MNNSKTVLTREYLQTYERKEYFHHYIPTNESYGSSGSVIFVILLIGIFLLYTKNDVAFLAYFALIILILLIRKLVKSIESNHLSMDPADEPIKTPTADPLQPLLYKTIITKKKSVEWDPEACNDDKYYLFFQIGRQTEKIEVSEEVFRNATENQAVYAFLTENFTHCVAIFPMSRYCVTDDKLLFNPKCTIREDT